MEGGDEEEAGPGWLDDADAALESFMQEDALLEAIQNAPALASAVSHFEVDEGADAESGAAHAAPLLAPAGHGHARSHGAGGAAAAAAAAAVSAEGAGLKARERRLEPLEIGAPSPRSEAPLSPSKGSSKGRARPLPWRAGLVFLLAVVGIVFWGPDLFGSSEAKRLPAHVDPKPIQLPAFDDEDAEPANASRFGERRGRVGVQWSSDQAANMTATRDAEDEGNGTARGDREGRGRRGRTRGKGSVASEVR